MTRPLCSQCHAELPEGAPPGLCQRCLASLARYPTTGPDPGTISSATPASPQVPDPEAESESFDADAYWDLIAQQAETANQLQTSADAQERALQALRDRFRDLGKDPDATPWDREQVGNELREAEALLAATQQQLQEVREYLQRTEQSVGRHTIRHLLAEHLPHLQIQWLVGRGGMGEVWLARHVTLGRNLAIKVLPPETGHQPGFAERFRQEARVMAMLDHPHIVTIFDYGEVGGLYFFIMEYLPEDLRDLKRYLGAKEEMSGDFRHHFQLERMVQLCDAVAYAHEEGVLHRDLKPENVRIKVLDVKLADFGLARLLNPDAVRLTGANQVLGTLAYMAPEQLDRPDEVDHRADVYALGVVFYEMLTGQLPRGHFDPPSKACGDERLDPILLKALAADPDQRYQKASELKDDLQNLHQQGVLWRKKGELRRATGLLNDGQVFLTLALLPLFLALHPLFESHQTLPWWSLLLIPCLMPTRRWTSPLLRTATFGTWFVALPACALFGLARGWEPVFGQSGQLVWALMLLTMAIAEVTALPKVVSLNNRIREIDGHPPLVPIPPGLARLGQKADGVVRLMSIPAFAAIGVWFGRMDPFPAWLPAFVTLAVAILVGGGTLLRTWMEERLAPDRPDE